MVKKIRVTNQVVKYLQQQARFSHDDELKALCKDWKLLKADVKFLLDRSQRAGSVSFTGNRETGRSSNSIVSIAYGRTKLKDQKMPSDISDLKACFRMWEKLPEHRKTKDARQALLRAIIKIDRKKPGELDWETVPGPDIRAEAE